MDDDSHPLIEAVVLLLTDALRRLDTQLEGTMFRTPGHKASLEEDRQHIRDLLDELTAGPSMRFLR